MRVFAAAMLLLCTGCTFGGASSSPPPAPAVRHLPPPSAHPDYPPAGLGDIVALAADGVQRRFLGAEGQSLESCSRGWERVLEPAGVAPRQAAADLLKVAIDRKVLLTSCGGFVFGTSTNDFPTCNCYHGEHGYLVVERGPAARPAAGKMRISFFVAEDKTSAGDWSIVVDQVDA